MGWGPIDHKYLTAVDMRCEDCGEVYIIHSMGVGQSGSLVLSIHEGCDCGCRLGRVVGASSTEEWPEFIDA